MAVFLMENGLNMAIPKGKADMLDKKGYDDKDIVFGIRPEDIHAEEAFLETWPDAVITSTVVVSELLGATIQLYQKVDGTEFVADVNSRDYHKPGDQVKMALILIRLTSSIKIRQWQSTIKLNFLSPSILKERLII